MRYAADVEFHELVHATTLGACRTIPAPEAGQNEPVHLVLASTSPSRLALLRMAGIEPEVVPSEVDEEGLVTAHGPATPAAHVQLLATAKAEAVFRSMSERSGSKGTLVLGCDSAFELDGVVYGKPHHAVVATARWKQMRGRTGTLHTGHCLVDPATGDRREAVVSTAVTFADVSDAEIDWYVATGEPLAVAGAFTLEGLAAPFITAIDGDPHAVVGLSLAALRTLALELGAAWTDLVSPAA